MSAERRGQQPILRFVLWFVAPLDDRIRGLSLTRILATACFVFVGHSVWEERALSWVDFWVLVLGTCSAYGKKMVYAFLSRIGLQSKSVDVTQRITAEIRDRREQGKDWDAEAS